MGIRHKPSLLEIYLSLAVDIPLICGHACDIRNEHRVAAKHLCLPDLAFESEGRCKDNGTVHRFTFHCFKAAFGEFVKLAAAFHSAEVNFFRHFRCGKIDDELPCFHYNGMGVPLGAY